MLAELQRIPRSENSAAVVNGEAIRHHFSGSRGGSLPSRLQAETPSPPPQLLPSQQHHYLRGGSSFY